MGADIISMVFKGKANRHQVELKLKKQRDWDAVENGHQSGYSGDWQCVDDLKFNCEIFNSKDEALKYLECTAEKWGPAIVVYYLTKDPKQCTIKTIVQAVVPC